MDDSYISVLERSKMLNSLLDAGGVIDMNAALVMAQQRIVESDHGQIAIEQAFDQFRVELRAHDGYAANFVLDHSADGSFGIWPRVVGHSQDELKVFSLACLLESLDKLRIKRVLNVGNN